MFVNTYDFGCINDIRSCRSYTPYHANILHVEIQNIIEYKSFVYDIMVVRKVKKVRGLY